MTEVISGNYIHLSVSKQLVQFLHSSSLPSPSRLSPAAMAPPQRSPTPCGTSREFLPLVCVLHSENTQAIDVCHVLI
jgi:hypothetical protein